MYFGPICQFADARVMPALDSQMTGWHFAGVSCFVLKECPILLAWSWLHTLGAIYLMISLQYNEVFSIRKVEIWSVGGCQKQFFIARHPSFPEALNSPHLSCYFPKILTLLSSLLHHLLLNINAHLYTMQHNHLKWNANKAQTKG